MAQPARAAAATGRPRVLVVDDEATIRDLLAKTLALAEYDVDLAPDGRTALEAVAKETQAYVYETAAKAEDDLLGKLKTAGMQVNTPNKDAFIAASKPVYEEYSKEVKGAKEVIDSAIALGK